jgi:protein arginine N-methyltransferase 1
VTSSFNLPTVLEEHHHYYRDSARNDAYARALEELVTPGARVLDLGSGTGLLGMLALRAGAGHVYAVDGGPILELARSLFKANGMEDRATFVRGWSTAVTLDEPVDLVVCDQIGNFGVGPGLFTVLSDARSRHLREGGATTPGRIALEVAPVHYPKGRKVVDAWKQPLHDLDFALVHETAQHGRFAAELESEHLLGDPVTVCEGDPSDPGLAHMKGDVRLLVNQAGMLHGLGGWWRARLSPSVETTNSPVAEDRVVSRHHVFLPIAEPLGVKPGDEIAVTISVSTREEMVAWTVEVGERTFRHGEFLGALGSAEDFRRHDPEHVPGAGERARAATLVLERAAAGDSFGVILLVLEEECPSLFVSREDREGFVRELLALVRDR